MTNDELVRRNPTPDPWVDVTPQNPDATRQPAAPLPAGPTEPYGAGPDAPVPAIDVTQPYRPVPAAPDAAVTRGGALAKLLGVFAVGAVAGALVVGAWHGFGGSTSSALTGQSTPPGGAPGVQGGVPGQAGQQGQQGVAPGAGGFGGPGVMGGAGGEQRVTGTLTAVAASTVTVKTASGSATYTISPQTEIVRGGAAVGASDLKVGDTVLAHVFPAQGSDGVLERLIVTSTATSGAAGAPSGDDSTT